MGRQACVRAIRRLALPLAVLTFFLNPGLACTGQDQFQYGEAEMKAAVEGTWVLTLNAGGTSSSDQLVLQISESSKARQVMRSGRNLIRSAAACDSRTFVASAHACIDVSDMPLDVVFVSGPDAYKDVALSGNLAVPSLDFSQGDLYLNLGSAAVFASIAPDGTVNRLSGGSNTVTLVSFARTAQ